MEGAVWKRGFGGDGEGEEVTCLFRGLGGEGLMAMALMIGRGAGRWMGI